MKSMYRVRMTPAEVKADLLTKLGEYAARYHANTHDMKAAYVLDKVEDELVQHYGMTYDEVHELIARANH